MEIFVRDAAGQRHPIALKEHDTLAQVKKEVEKVLGYIEGCTDLKHEGEIVVNENGKEDSSFSGLTGIRTGEDIEAVYSNTKLKAKFMESKISYGPNSPEVLLRDPEIALLVVDRDVNLFRHAHPSLRGDKDFMLLAASRGNGNVLQFATDDLRDSIEFATLLIKSRRTLSWISLRVQEDPRIKLLQKAATSVMFPDPAVADDTEIALLQIKCFGAVGSRSSKSMSKDNMDQHRCCMQHVSERLRGDREFVMTAVKHDGLSLKHASEALRKDIDVVSVAVEQNGMALRYAFDEEGEDEDGDVENESSEGEEEDFNAMTVVDLKKLCEARGVELPKKPLKKNIIAALEAGDDDSDSSEEANYNEMKVGVLRELCKKRTITVPPKTNKVGLVELLENYDEKQREDKKKEQEAAAQAVGEKREREPLTEDEHAAKKQKTDAEVVEQTALPKSLKSDVGIALKAVKQNWRAIWFVKGAAKDDREVAVAAVKENDGAYDFISKRAQKDKDVAAAWVSHDGHRVKHLPTALKKEKCVALAAVRQNGKALWLLKSFFGDDRDVALVASKTGGWKHISERLMNDKEIVLKAAAFDGKILRDLSKELKNDKEVAMVAVRRSGDAIAMVGSSLKTDADLKEESRAAIQRLRDQRSEFLGSRHSGRPYTPAGGDTLVATMATGVGREAGDWTSRPSEELPALSTSNSERSAGSNTSLFASRREAAAAWRADALAEHASVASFSKFSLELMGVGAPSQLIWGAHEAALQEIGHAKMCFHVAELLDGESSGPGKLPAHELQVGNDVAVMATSTALEGAVGETLAAIGAAVKLRCMEAMVVEDSEAVQTEIGEVLRVVVEEEAQHAALAWNTLGWALGQGPVKAAVQASVGSAFESVLKESEGCYAMCRARPAALMESLEAAQEQLCFGVMPDAQRKLVDAVIMHEVVAPLVRTLMGEGGHVAPTPMPILEEHHPSLVEAVEMLNGLVSL